MGTIKEKIQEYLEYKGITPTATERKLNWGVGAFTKAKSITADRAKEFLLLFDDLSAEWLLRGTGEMLLSESSSQDSPIIEDSNSFYERMIDKKDKRIEELALLVGNLQKEVEMLKRDKKIAPEMGDALGVVERMKPTGTEGL